MIALDTVQEVRGATQREQELRRIVRAVRTLRNGNDRDGVLEQVLRIVGREAECERAVIFTFERTDQMQQMRVQAHWSELRNGAVGSDWEKGDLLQEEDCWNWYGRLVAGEVICAHADELPADRRAVFYEQGIRSALLLPIHVEDVPLGALRFDSSRRENGWTSGEVDVLNEFAQDVGTVLARNVEAGSPMKAEDARGITVRSRVDRVLVDVSHLLVSQRDFAPVALLEAVGEAIKASHVYLITIPPNHPLGEAAEDGPGKLTFNPRSLRERWTVSHKSGWPRKDACTYHEWFADPDKEREAGDGGDKTPSLVIPILSEHGLLYGYLGIEREGALVQARREEQVLHVLGNMLATYLERRMAEAAFESSEERYRAFVRTVLEGIWCIEIDPGLDVTLPVEEQLGALRERGIIVECNESIAHALGATDPNDVIGRKAGEVVPEGFDEKFFRDAVTHGYDLRNRPYALHNADEPVRHFVTSALGTIEDGLLRRVWASWTDVTERVELERRMVAALEQQQERIGRELHDGVGQLLTGIGMLGQNVAERHFEKDDEGYERMQKILRFTQEAVQLVGELQRGLAPVQVYERGLVGALQDLAYGTDGLSDISCTFKHDSEADVEDREISLQLFRIAQEATNNALKHASTVHIHISLSIEEGRPVLEVQDDGLGFDSSQPTDQSLGLYSMKYRARSVGASLTIDAEPGRGTTIRCELP